MNKFATKKFALSASGLILATWLCLVGKIDGSAWVCALMVALTGHQAEDIVNAVKGTKT